MSFDVSPQVRIVALVGLLAGLAMLGAMFFLMRPPAAADDSAPVIKPLYGGKKVAASAGTSGLAAAVTAKPKPPARANPKSKVAAPSKKRETKPVAPAKAAATAIAPPAAEPQKPPVVVSRPVPNPQGLPLPIARQLVDYEVVVVALYNPEAHVDALALGEARAGAELARRGDPRIGFVALDVLRHGGPLTRKLGVLSDPALFVYRGDGQLALRIDGFADRDTVAQAALDVVRQ